MKPAPYPNNTSEELEAINVLCLLLDSKFVIPHINRLDKVPNTDGHVEIINEEKAPLGKLEVQVRKIPNGSTTYPCPIELIAYSQTISVPFLLIGVDVGNRKAYFRHLHRSMPEVKPEQKTFKIKFEPSVHAIANETQYLRQWLEIINDYNHRIADYPRLRQIERKLDLAHISKDDRIYFQEFIEHINFLLDVEFPVVKEQFFAGTWKLGVGVSSADPEEVGFQIFAIAPGDPAILVSGIEERVANPLEVRSEQNIVSFRLQGAWPRECTIQFNWTKRSQLKPAKAEAQEFVFRYLNRLLREKALPLYGTLLSTEYLFWFADRYPHCLGLSPGNEFTVRDLNYGIHVYMPAWYSIALPKYISELKELNKGNYQNLPFPPFEAVLGSVLPEGPISPREVNRLIASDRIPPPCPVRETEVSLRSLSQAVSFLAGANIQAIKRPYKPRSRPLHWAWSGYTVEALRHNLQSILIDSWLEYKILTEGNGIRLPLSTFLSGTVATVYTANLVEWAAASDSPHAPILTIHTLGNRSNNIPKVTFLDLSRDGSDLIILGKKARFRGIETDLVRTLPTHPVDLFGGRPALNRVYDMLNQDLRNQYGLNNFPG